MTANDQQELFNLPRKLYRNLCVLVALLLGSLCAGGAMAYDVEVDSVDNKVYILLINDNPGDSYDAITIDSVPPGIVTSADAWITPPSVVAGGSDLAAIQFTISASASLGATGSLFATASGMVGGQAVEVQLEVPLTVVASAPVAQGFVGSTEPAPDPNGVDSDGDGVTDALETAFGSNPNSASSMPGQPQVEENVPLFGALGAALLALLLFGTGAASARHRNAGLLALAVVVLLPLDLMAGSSTRIQLVAHIPIPPPDADADGVPDSNDLCPNTPPGTFVDSDGCAIPPQLLSATATAKSQGSAGGAALAVDGNIGSRWESQHGVDPQWIVLDLGARHLLDETIIRWEAANAATYEVQGSIDNSNWTPLASFTGGVWDPGTGVRRTDTHSLDGVYRYVRMYGMTRPSGNIYGYSIWEMEVYGWLAPDADDDGVDDSSDQCPNTPAGATVDANGCEIVDTDGDGVPDGQDQCANTPAGANVDANGCEIIVQGIEVASIETVLAGGFGSSQPGFTLYVFDSDPVNGGVSNCNDGCATTWPPLLVHDGVASGVDDLGMIVRNDGSKQATHDGRPLYFYTGDSAAGQTNGNLPAGWHSVTLLEPVTAYVRSSDGVVVTRFGDRGRDRHAKDIGYYGGTNWDHYDHYLAEYWHYRTARIQIEDFVTANTPQSLIRFTYITENRLGAKEFRAWFYGLTTTGQFHFNGGATEDAQHGRFDDNFNYVRPAGPGESDQYKYTIDVTQQWKDVGTAFTNLFAGVNMEIEISQFLVGPPSGARLNYYGTSYVYVIGTPGLAPFEWQRGVNNPNGVNDGTPIPAAGLLGGDTTLGYNYSEEPAGRFMQMATNLSHINAQPFVRGRRVHHTNFINGSHDERAENPIWSQQVGKAGNHYINTSCANCHVRNGRALVADVGSTLDKWVFKVGDANGDPDPNIGSVLQPNQTGAGAEGTVTLGAWTDLANGLREPNYIFENSQGTFVPEGFSARIAPQLVGIGLLEAVPESEILAWEDPLDSNSDGISGRAASVIDPVSGVSRLGRFGYKAATASVEHQVAAALNTDIGVMTSVLPAPDCGSSQTTCGSAGSELADTELNDLVKYISLLGVGARRDYDVTTGETLFNNAGCEGCHRNTLTTSASHPLNELRSQTIHPYTDLLLHDMGDDLADNLGEGSANGAEWRTAPLWGLGHARSVMLGDAKANDTVTQPIDPNDVNRIGYLHDGRARTIDEAIRWHGGEAETAKLAYEALSQGDKDALLAFLESL